MSVKLLAEHYLEFLSLKEGCTGSSESNLSKCHIIGNHMSRIIIIEVILMKNENWCVDQSINSYISADPFSIEFKNQKWICEHCGN